MSLHLSITHYFNLHQGGHFLQACVFSTLTDTVVHCTLTVTQFLSPSLQSHNTNNYPVLIFTYAREIFFVLNSEVQFNQFISTRHFAGWRQAIICTVNCIVSKYPYFDFILRISTNFSKSMIKINLPYLTFFFLFITQILFCSNDHLLCGNQFYWHTPFAKR